MTPSERSAREAELQQDLDDWRRRGLLRCDLRTYGRPWPEARANNPAAWTLAKTWTPAAGNLYLWGENGVGKSACMRYVLCQQWWRGRTVADISGVGLAARFTGFDARIQFDQLMRVKVLGLDDLDKAHFTDYSIAMLWELLDFRNESRLPTIITAQYSPEDFHACIAKSSVNPTMATSLLKRLRPARVIRMQGQDLRKLRAPGSWEKTSTMGDQTNGNS